MFSILVPGHSGAFLRSVSLLVLGLALAGCQDDVRFSHDVQSAVRPWTHERFHNNPNDLRFAVIADRTGGAREGVFESAIAKVNRLAPEFILSVGDLMEGHNEKDPVKLAAQYNEVDGILGQLSMPFFFLTGNHDVSNTVMAREYASRRGQSYYSFVYKNVLFVILDAQDGPVGKNEASGFGLGERQIAWARRTITSQPQVRWTFVLMHQALWIYEEGGLTTARHRATKPMSTGFPQIEAALAGRSYTVLAGHYHQYIKSMRHGQKYVMLASTGGDSALRGPSVGEFDGVLWVSMAHDGPPQMTNLLLDGIVDENTHTEERLRFSQRLLFSGSKAFPDKEEMRFTLPVSNSFGKELTGNITWSQPADSAWTITPDHSRFRLAPGQATTMAFAARAESGRRFPLPAGRLRLSCGDEEWQTALPLPLDVDAYLKDHRPTLTARSVPTPIAIDGRIDEAAWKTAPDAPAFQSWTLDAEPTVKTRAWIAWDSVSYYVAMRCDEPRMDRLKSSPRARDEAVYDDDCIDVMVGPDAAQPQTYYQFIVNPDGAIYDAKGMDKSFDTTVRVATTRDDFGWTVEVAIPWSELGITPAAGAKLSFLLARSRPLRAPDQRQILQYPPLNGWNHRWENHGLLNLGE